MKRAKSLVGANLVRPQAQGRLLQAHTVRPYGIICQICSLFVFSWRTNPNQRHIQ